MSSSRILVCLVAVLTLGAVPADASDLLNPRQLRVLAVNGGGRPAINYQSHLLHVRQLRDLLLATGVAPDRISVVTADGDDPTPDLTVREHAPLADAWVAQGTALGAALDVPATRVSSAIPSATLRPATKRTLTHWFQRTRFRPDDVFFLYVTDHGEKNADDLANNRITLWGKDEALTVDELGRLLARVPRSTRIVTLMSQCYSGSFAHLLRVRSRSGHPDGTLCGYFSSTADRPAYGCYPENRGRDNVGHSFHFIEALARTGRFDTAHTVVLERDATPDVPMRTSDAYASEVLTALAARRQMPVEVVVDELLAGAWSHKADWESEVRLLDRIAGAFGIFSPRSLAELDAQAGPLPTLTDQVRTSGKSWDGALTDATRATVDRFIAAHPGLANRLPPKGDAHGLRERAPRILRGLRGFTSRDAAGALSRLEQFHRSATASRTVGYRLDVREGVILRMKNVLREIAVREHFRGNDGPEARAYAALRACEAVALPVPQESPVPELAAPEPFPSFDEDLATAKTTLPAWLGVQYKSLEAAERTESGLHEGAARITQVYPDSPALRAGLEVGDVVVGPPNQPFRDEGNIRQWAMLSAPSAPVPLIVQRDGVPRELTIVPGEFPGKWPELPGPVKVGAKSKKLSFTRYRGTPKAVRVRGPHVLFFWATWCGPCKAALPELLAYEAKTGTPIIAVTDEGRATLDTFFASFDQPFPQHVAMDRARRSFVAYGVNGTPAFVLIDGDRKVVAVGTGYGREKGLPFPDWAWKPEPARVRP